jgi:transcriptional regulator with XRE-family HTH domain
MMAMKQPELGKKLTELRKAKGLTQEELVEKCNINVRTIQRIEAGEVTPRSFTVKVILAAMDYSFNDIKIEDASSSNQPPASTAFQPKHGTQLRIKHLTSAWIFGIIYFVLGFLEGTAEYFRFEDNEMIFSIPVYVAIKLATIISFVFFQRGFFVLGDFYDNYLLKIASMVLIAMHVLLGCYDIVSVFYDAEERIVVLFGAAVTYGAVGVVYGLSLRRLERHVGRSAEVAGILEIAAAMFFFTVVLGFIGEMILVPAELIEILILFKVVELIRGKTMQVAG